MSKQLGNSPDPLDLIAKYGADGMRVAMLLSSSAGNDVMFDEALCEQGRNFGNKIWNAYRLIGGWSVDPAAAQSENDRLAVAWFEQALGRALRQIEEDFAQYRISEALMKAYKLFWDDFSGLYLEMVKPRLRHALRCGDLAATGHKRFFDALMRILHPFMPFVTEEIWQDLAPRAAGESIMTAPRCPNPRPRTHAHAGPLRAGPRGRIRRAQTSATRRTCLRRRPLVLRVIADENYPAEFAPVIRKMANLSQIETATEKDPRQRLSWSRPRSTSCRWPAASTPRPNDASWPTT